MKRQPKHPYRIELWKRNGDDRNRNRRYYDDIETAKTAYAHYLIRQMQCEMELERIELQGARFHFDENHAEKWEYVPLLRSYQNYIDLLTC